MRPASVQKLGIFNLNQATAGASCLSVHESELNQKRNLLVFYYYLPSAVEYLFEELIPFRADGSLTLQPTSGRLGFCGGVRLKLR